MLSKVPPGRALHDVDVACMLGVRFTVRVLSPADSTGVDSAKCEPRPRGVGMLLDGRSLLFGLVMRGAGCNSARHGAV